MTKVLDNIEKTVNDFLKELQWDLRASFNSSSCLGQQQRYFLKDSLQDLLIKVEGEERKND